MAGWTEETSFMFPGTTYATVVYWEKGQRKNHFLPPQVNDAKYSEEKKEDPTQKAL